MIEEIEVRVNHMHAIIRELEQFGNRDVLNEPLEPLRLLMKGSLLKRSKNIADNKEYRKLMEDPPIVVDYFTFDTRPTFGPCQCQIVELREALESVTAEQKYLKARDARHRHG
ncbi:Endoplasmic reticulum vesicle protein 25 [Artemisia annua]|uniref:Endoplasmic reticulum vesicle protein 25 n=1 Tax=Artemisia annua TaxID=35608 RepID=A0A2U1QAI7_ARTAN|nr:Endoplasmic reticulum vesicle protein 25 [Artemisia annua]